MAYQFQPGTIPHAAWLHLKTLPTGGEICTAELASAIGQEGVNLGPYLVTATQHGALRSRKVGKLAYWSVGDGELLVRPAIEGEDADEEPPPQRKPRSAQSRPASPLRSVAARSPETPCESAHKAKKLRVAIWSDGALQIQRGPDDVVLFTPEETAQLVRYLDRLAVPA